MGFSWNFWEDPLGISWVFALRILRESNVAWLEIPHGGKRENHRKKVNFPVLCWITTWGVIVFLCFPHQRNNMNGPMNGCTPQFQTKPPSCHAISRSFSLKWADFNDAARSHSLNSHDSLPSYGDLHFPNISLDMSRCISDGKISNLSLMGQAGKSRNVTISHFP